MGKMFLSIKGQHFTPPKMNLMLSFTLNQQLLKIVERPITFDSINKFTIRFPLNEIIPSESHQLKLESYIFTQNYTRRFCSLTENLHEITKCVDTLSIELNGKVKRSHRDDLLTWALYNPYSNKEIKYAYIGDKNITFKIRKHKEDDLILKLTNYKDEILYSLYLTSEQLNSNTTMRLKELKNIRNAKLTTSYTKP